MPARSAGNDSMVADSQMMLENSSFFFSSAMPMVTTAISVVSRMART